MKNSFYRCPLCSGVLVISENAKSYSCHHNHSFDIAKEGYVNLMTVQQKASLEPGDSKEMLLSRHAFLEANHYKPLADVLARMLSEFLPAEFEKPKVLDLGCGEGYYSRNIEEYAEIYGIDISKFAIAFAAKQQKNAHFAVASSNALPFEDDFFDGIIRVFAPSHSSELQRVIKKNGFLIMVTPAPRHLWQLKEFIYKNSIQHETENIKEEGFALVKTENLSFSITPTSTERMQLLHMTPFAWRATKSVEQKIESLKSLSIDIDFTITVLQKL